MHQRYGRGSHPQRGSGHSQQRRRSGGGGGALYPAIGPSQFSFEQLVRQAVENRHAVIFEMMGGEAVQAVILREDQFTFSVLIGDELRILYKHAIKFIVFAKT